MHQNTTGIWSFWFVLLSGADGRGHGYQFANKKRADYRCGFWDQGAYFDAAVAPTTTVPVVDILRGCEAASTEGALLVAGVAVAGTLSTGAGGTDTAADADTDSEVEAECPAA